MAEPLRIIHGGKAGAENKVTVARPVIGITASEDDAPADGSPRHVVAVPSAYVAAVERSGGAALLLPAQSAGREELFAVLDGLVLSGGPDVAPDHYGELSHPRSQRPHVERDAFEIALVKLASDADVPVLAICRGIQVLERRGGAARCTSTCRTSLATRGTRPGPASTRRTASRSAGEATSGRSTRARSRHRATTTRRSPEWGAVSTSSPSPGTARSRPSRTRPAAFSSACSGTPR